MCCDGWDFKEDTVGVCPNCGEDVDADGDAVTGCYWSPVDCELCESRTCDDSC